MLQRPTIPHFEGLNVDNINLEGQKPSLIWDRTGLMFVKSILFRKKGRGKSLKLPRPCPSRFILSITIAKNEVLLVFLTCVIFE